MQESGQVVVLMGGNSAERDVSLVSGRMVMAALEEHGFDARSIDTGEPDWARRFLSGPAPQCAVIALHGPGGEDGTLQGFLETVGVPYIGSGVMASSVCMDKELTKAILKGEGIPVPQSLTVSRARRDSHGFAEALHALPLPLVVKPNRQGSTIGMTKVTQPEALVSAVDEALRYSDDALLEEFVSGVEITVCVLGGADPEPLPLIEIVPQSGFYDYHDKYTPGATEEIIPARISDRASEKARRYGLTAHRRLRCWGMSRTDMIVGEDDIWVLEVNTIPGMTPTSLLPRAAGFVGLSLGDVLDRLVKLAAERPEGY